MRWAWIEAWNWRVESILVGVRRGSLLLRGGRGRKRWGGELVLGFGAVRVRGRWRRVLVVGKRLMVGPWNVERSEPGRHLPLIKGHDAEMVVVVAGVEQRVGDLVVEEGISMEEPWRALVGIRWTVAVLDVQAGQSEPIVQEQIKPVVEVE